MGSSMSSSPSYGRQQLYFDPDVDWTPPIPDYCSTEYELRQKLVNLVDVVETIDEVRYYTHPLNTWQMSKVFLHHAFIVLKTESWFWSIEKDEGGITIQRSKHIESVRDKCRRQNRITGLTSGIGMTRKNPGNNVTVIEVLNHLWREDHMNLHYNFLENNCQHFSGIIYDFVLMSCNKKELLADANIQLHVYMFLLGASLALQLMKMYPTRFN